MPSILNGIEDATDATPETLTLTAEGVIARWMTVRASKLYDILTWIDLCDDVLGRDAT